MKKFGRRKTGVRWGAAMVEFAFVLPVFTTMLLGVVEFGRAFMAYEMVVNASREGGRRAVLPSTVSVDPVRTVVDAVLTASAVPPADAVTTATLVGGGSLANANRGDTVEVRVTIPFSSVSFLSPQFLVGSNIVSVTHMRRE